MKSTAVRIVLSVLAGSVALAVAAEAQTGKKLRRASKSIDAIATDFQRRETLTFVRYNDVISAAHGVILLSDGQRLGHDAEVAERLVDTLLEDLSAPPPADFEKLVGATEPVDNRIIEKIQSQRKRAAANAALFKDALSGFEFADADERILTKLLLAESALDRKSLREQALKDWLSGPKDERTAAFAAPRLDEHVDRLLYIALGVNRYGLYEIRPDLANYWTARTLDRWLEILRDRFRLAPTYQQSCTDNGVPSPPDWPGAGWAPLQPLPYTLNLLQSGSDTKVAIHEVTSGPQEGVCIGLPRTNGTFTSLFGIICQSKATGKACFYDNIDQSGRRISGPEATLSLRIADLQNGDTLAENCTDCHRGGNAFLVTPGTPLAQPRGNPLVRYSPVSSQPAWANPAWHARGSAGPTGAIRACAACHEIPQPTRAYCDRVLEQAARRTMTNPATPAGWWPSPAPAYTEHMREFFAVCLPPHLARS